MEKGVSSYRRERFLASKKRPLYLKLIVSTPLSIRRGVGGEASSLSTTSSLHSPLHYFPSVSDRWFGEGVRLLLYFKQIFEALLPTRTMYVPGANEMCISAVAAFAR